MKYSLTSASFLGGAFSLCIEPWYLASSLICDCSVMNYLTGFITYIGIVAVVISSSSMIFSLELGFYLACGEKLSTYAFPYMTGKGSN
jgi:hypothetical protein